MQKYRNRSSHRLSGPSMVVGSRGRCSVPGGVFVPERCFSLQKHKQQEIDLKSVRTGRAVYVFCALLFIGTGLYNVLF